MGFRKKSFPDLPLAIQLVSLREADRIVNSRNMGSPMEEFEWLDTPMSVYMGDHFMTHAYTRVKPRHVTVEAFIEEVLESTRDLIDGMEELSRDVHDLCFFWVSHDNRFYPLSIPKEKIAKLGVEDTIRLLLNAESNRGEENWGGGSGMDILRNTGDFYLNTSYFTLGSRARGEPEPNPKRRSTNKSSTDDISEDTPLKDSRFFKKNYAGFTTSKYLGFDFETVVQRSHFYMIPYAYSMGVYREDGAKIRTYTKISANEDEVRNHLCDSLRRERPKSKDEGVYLVGFNNSRFDNFLLHQTITERRLRYTDPFIVKNSILGLTVKDNIVKDLLRFVHTPLRKACKDFGCSIGKRELPHWKYQMAYYDGDERFKRYLGRKEDTIRDYVERDVDSMMELGFKCKDAYLGLTGLYIENYYILASVGYNYYKTIVPKKYWDKRPMMDEKLEKFVREGVCGGRSQVFQPYSHPKEEVGEADVKSQYPYEMASNEYPLGDEIWTKKYHPGKIGIYRARIGVQPGVNIVAHNDGKTANWDYKEVIARVISNVTIELLREENIPCKILEGVYWAETDYVFKEFLEKLHKTKKEQDHYKKDDDPRYNPSLRNIVKLLMNALSGKMVEKTHTSLTMLVQTKSQLKRLLSKVEGDTIEKVYSDSRFLTYLKGTLKDKHFTRNIPTVWGILIYEYSRINIWRKVSSTSRQY